MNILLLRRLETYGFKSFAEKTELEFGKGITAIVGPNGSGKSNISDAIRWALGEQSIRTLRGSKSEDVIFAGSAKRRPLGVAEVSLILDNSDHGLPIDFNEVIITRRVFRSGDSEYYINKSLCRLKDIHELLADTGLGRDSMSIIGQNKVDEVLNSKPEERRALFEEAAGITKYKNRKRDALRKIEETTQNQNRVSDLLSEIEGQLDPMERNAQKTRQYRYFEQEHNAYQATLVLHKLNRAEKMVTSAKLEQDNLNDLEIAAVSQIATLEADKEKLTNELSEIETELSAIDADLAKTYTDCERLEGQKAVLEERIRQAKRSLQRLDEEMKHLSSQEQELAIKLKVDQSKIEEKKSQFTEFHNDIMNLTSLYEQYESKIMQVELQINRAKEESLNYLERLTDSRNDLKMVKREMEILENRKEIIDKEYQQNKDQLVTVQTKRQQVLINQETISNTLHQMKEHEHILGQKKQNTLNLIDESRRSQQERGAKLQDQKSRLKVLAHMQEDHEGFNKSVKQILRTQHQWRNNICGAVAELLQVPEEFVIAVETALGGAQQYIVTENEEIAKKAILFLKIENLGRATFLPLTVIKPAFPKESEISAAKAKGALGFASQLVNCHSSYKPVRDYLLGRIIVAENIEIALKIAKQYLFSLRIVTLDGQLVNPGGSLTGGSVQRRESSFFSRNNEIGQLKRQIEELTDQWLITKKQEEALQEEVEQTEKEIESYRKRKQEMQIRQAEMAVELEKLVNDSKRLEATIESLSRQLQHNVTDWTALGDKKNILVENIPKLASHDVQWRDQTTAWQEQLTIFRGEKEGIISQITDRKVALAGLEQNIEALFNQSHDTEEQMAKMSNRRDSLQAEINNAEAEIALSNQDLIEIDGTKSEVLAHQIAQQKQRQTIIERKVDKLSIIQKGDRELRDLRRRHGDLQNRLHEMELMVAKYQFKITHSTEQLKQMHLSKEMAQELHRDGDYDELIRQVQYWENEISGLGPINPQAIEEYERIADRYHFLRQHSDDLTAAQNSLIAIIRDMDSTMAKQFSAAFQVINTKFGETFNRLFGGGQAGLELLNPENILDTGIEILVQPPGKKRQNLALLSGGERALTVIALLFSFLAFRPAPFCVVDEIDAALDEANVQRFSDFLQDYARHTQFIIVTHRKGTMEAAHVMQGVTMEESGVSRLLSVKFMDNAG